MPILDTPPNEDEPEQEIVVKPASWEEHRRVQLFLNVASWKCECGITNFGRNLQCAKDTCKKPRPAHYSKIRGLK